MFNIIKFCGKLFTGAQYLLSFLYNPQGYERIPSEVPRRKKSFFQRSKEYIYNFFKKNKTRNPDIIIPLYETQNPSFFQESQPFAQSAILRQEEINMFQKHYEELCAEEEEEDDNINQQLPFHSVNLNASYNLYKPTVPSNLVHAIHVDDDKLFNQYL
jgi:hypothetical protein